MMWKWVVGAIAFIVLILTLIVRANALVSIFHRSEQRVIQAAPPAKPDVVITPPTPDNIPGTLITHSQLKNLFPFGYVLISFRDGYEAFDPRLQEDQLKIDVDWKQIKITPDFEKRTVVWEVRNMHVYKPHSRVEMSDLNIRQEYPMTVGSAFQYPMGFGKASPHIHFGTLNDNQVSPIFVLGFRIPEKRN